MRANRGAAGIDKQSIAEVERHGVDRLLDELAADLKDGRWRPLPTRRVCIPKPGRSGERRPLSIPTVRDRVVQAAVKIVIEPIFEADMLECSFGFRPERSAHDALRGDLACPCQCLPAPARPAVGRTRHRSVIQNESQIGLHGLLPLGWSNALVFPETLNQSHRCMLRLLVSIPLGTHEDDPQTSFFAVKSPEQKNYLFHSRPYARRRRLGCLLKVVSQL